MHEVTVHKGTKVEKHLCEICAKDEGVVVQHPPMSTLLSKFVISTEPGAKDHRPACPICAMTFAEFRQHGLLGCPSCYQTFEEQLIPLLERAHEGGSLHVGKIPRRAGKSLDRHQRLAALRRELTEAVSLERYERAAELRDELRTVGDVPPDAETDHEPELS